jgi:uncharacterized protein (DUF433 family)
MRQAAKRHPDGSRVTPSDATHRRLSYRPCMQALVLDPPPLTRDDDGVIRVGRTRVTLASVVFAFDAGATPEEIVQKYPTLDLASVYAVCAHVLTHRSEVDAYLEAQALVSEQVREEWNGASRRQGFVNVFSVGAAPQPDGSPCGR